MDPEELRGDTERDDAADASGGAAHRPFGKFSGLKLTGAFPEEGLHGHAASPQPVSPQPVSWLQPSAHCSQPFRHQPGDPPSQPGSLAPPCAPQYGGGAPAYEAMDVYADIYGDDVYLSLIHI